MAKKKTTSKSQVASPEHDQALSIATTISAAFASQMKHEQDVKTVIDLFEQTYRKVKELGKER